MVFRAAIFLGAKRVGAVTFRNLLVTHPSHYVCEPPGVLSFEQVMRLAEQMWRLPVVPGGAIGQYEWRDESSSRETVATQEEPAL
jgi:hypothetical protein